MATDLMSDLERLGDLLQRASDPITVDQIRNHDAGALDERPKLTSLGDLEIGDSDSDQVRVVVAHRYVRTRPRRGWRTAAALSVAAAVLGVLWVVTSRPADDPSVGGPTDATAPTSSAAAVGGRMTLGAVPAGWSFEAASDSRLSTDAIYSVERIYATNSAAPETMPALALTAFPADVGSPSIPDSAEPVSVLGADGHLFPSAGGGQSLAFGPIDGFHYLLVGYHVSRDQLVAAANAVHQAPDRYGAIVDSTALPPGVSEKGAGVVSEIWFITKEAAAHPIPEGHWTNGPGSLWYYSFADAALPPLGRLGFETVTDTTVNGHPGYLATSQQFNVVSLTWSDDDRSYMVASHDGLGADELHATASSLRPATSDEWAAMTRARATVTATEPASTSVATSLGANDGEPRVVNGGVSGRLAPLPDGLAQLGFTLQTVTTDPTSGVATASARDELGGRTVALTVTPGTLLVVPENHDRVPITVLEQTELVLRAEVNSNDGWKFEITLTRTTTGSELPTIDAVQQLLYSIDP